MLLSNLKDEFVKLRTANVRKFDVKLTVDPKNETGSHNRVPSPSARQFRKAPLLLAEVVASGASPTIETTPSDRREV